MVRRASDVTLERADKVDAKFELEDMSLGIKPAPALRLDLPAEVYFELGARETLSDLV